MEINRYCRRYVQQNVRIASILGTEENAGLFAGMCSLEGRFIGTRKFGPKGHVAYHRFGPIKRFAVHRCHCIVLLVKHNEITKMAG
jgi:hypothetical protein